SPGFQEGCSHTCPGSVDRGSHTCWSGSYDDKIIIFCHSCFHLSLKAFHLLNKYRLRKKAYSRVFDLPFFNKEERRNAAYLPLGCKGRIFVNIYFYDTKVFLFFIQFFQYLSKHFAGTAPGSKEI